MSSKSRTDLKNYARALAEASGDRIQTLHELEQAAAIVTRVPLAKQVLLNASIETEDKRQQAIAGLLKDHSPLTRQFLDLTLREGLLDELPRLAQTYRQILKSQYKVAEVQIESAVPLAAADRDSLVAEVVPPGREALVQEVIKPELLGGVRVIVDDREHDLTLSGALDSLKQQLVNQ